MGDMSSKKGETPSRDEAMAKLLSMGTDILFEKVLTTSDANGHGRIVIPKSQAETHFPEVDSQMGQILPIMDTFNKKHNIRFRFWINNASRMYLMENAQDMLNRYRLQVGDVLIFSRNSDGQYFVCGRKGTKEDLSRKTAAKRLSEAAAARRQSKAAKPMPQDVPKAKRPKVKQVAATQNPGVGYWGGYSLPSRRDGVFRAMLNGSMHETSRVAAQGGCWTAIVNICGEPYQAFFDSQEAASEALEAALFAPLAAPPVRSPPPPPAPGPGRGSEPEPPPRGGPHHASLGALADVAAMMPTLSAAIKTAH